MNLLFAGYYGFNNVGDELILSSLIHETYRRYPRSIISVLSSCPRVTKSQHHVNSYSRWSPLQLYRILDRVDSFILGGGDLFQDATSWRTLPYYTWLALWAHQKKVPVHLVGVSFDHLSRKLSPHLIRSVVARASSISVRDKNSLELLRSLGCQKNVRTTTDLVLGMEKTKPHPVNPLEIMIILRSEFTSVQWGEQLKDFALEVGCRLVFVPFSSDDEIISENMVKICGSSARWERWKSIDNLRVLFSRMELVLSQRLHGLIMSSLCGVPSVALPAWPKVTRFSEILGAEKLTQLDKSSLVMMWQKRKLITENMQSKLPRLASLARSTLDGVL